MEKFVSLILIDSIDFEFNLPLSMSVDLLQTIPIRLIWRETSQMGAM